LKLFSQYLPDKWNFLAGNYDDFEPANRAFNAVSIITLIILVILLPFNIIIGLYPVAFLMIVLIALQSFFYYQSRWKKKYVAGYTYYTIASYITLFCNFFLNGGTLGPTLYLFFLTFQLLIAFSPRKQHPLWAILHLVIPTILLVAEAYHPAWIGGHYPRTIYRLLDLSSSYLVILVCMYGITIYLRNNYNRERKIAQERAEEIAAQNQRLEAMDAEKNKLFSIISHDLKSPLGTIISSLELLTEYDLEEEDRKKLKKELLHLSRNTSDMLLNLLYWSSARIKGVNIIPADVDLKVVIHKILNIHGVVAAAKSVNINIDISSGLSAHGDTDIIELILRNLVQNAIKFTPAGGQVFINAHTFEEGVLCTITDTGVGIPQEQLQHLFSLKAAGTTYGTNNEKGTGLGLMLCKEFTTMLHGRIWAESKAGDGSQFYLYLPSRAHSAAILSVA